MGSGGTYSVNRLVELLGGEVVYIPKRPGEPDCTFADTAKIAARLGWRPRVRFEDGVRIMLDGIEKWRDAPVWDPKFHRRRDARLVRLPGRRAQEIAATCCRQKA